MAGPTVAELTEIAKAGGGFDLDANEYSAAEVLEFADNMYQGSRLRIRCACAWSAKDMALVAQTAPPGTAEFVF